MTLLGWICCRFPDESDELRRLGHLLRYHQSKHFSPFFMICEEDEENHGFLRSITKEVIAAMIHESTFKIDMLEIRPSFELARTTISLCLSKDGEMFAISGFPRHIGSVTPHTPIRAIPQSGPPIRESDATIREWELLYESGPRFLIARYLGIGPEGAEFPLFTSLFSPIFFTLPYLIF